MFHRITLIEPNANNYTIALTYDDGLIVSVDFADMLESGVMTALKPPDVFNSVQIGSRGRSIVWQEFDIDFCADSLRSKLTYKGYTAQIDFDDHDNIFVGRLLGIKDVIAFHADNVADLKEAFIEAVDDYLEACATIGKAPEKKVNEKNSKMTVVVMPKS